MSETPKPVTKIIVLERKGWFDSVLEDLSTFAILIFTAWFAYWLDSVVIQWIGVIFFLLGLAATLNKAGNRFDNIDSAIAYLQSLKQ